jgi:DNA-binding MarR family transcriptional regulator
MAHLALIPGIHRAAHRIERYLQRVETELGVTRAEAEVLSHLAIHHRAAVSELGHAFGLKPSTLTSVLDRLDGRGLIGREIHPQDRRSFAITLTTRGAAAARRALASLSELENRVTDEVTQRDLKGFQSVVDAVEKHT